jgi:1-acyl-sn-glycerol-3-phosphate acyltransferase
MAPSEVTTRVPQAPGAAQMDRLALVVSPLARITQPRFYGIERLPNRGALYVGNHTIYSFLDLPFMIGELWTRRRIVLRGLGDHAHYAIPVWRNLLDLGGMVRSTRENVRALMANGQNVLVFPGGADEVFKRRGEKYKLLWKERLGFARLAIEFGYPVVPFAAVGAEEMLEVVVDERTPILAQISALTRRLVGLPLPPIAHGIGPTLLPRPERLYFWFGEPIGTERFGSDYEDDESARALRDEVRRAVEDGISFLRSERENDPRRRLRGRLRGGDELPGLAETDPDVWFVHCAFDAWNSMGPSAGAAWMSRWVTLEDPPQQPDFRVSRGRDTVLERLDEVCDAFGGRWAQVREARTLGDDVLVTMDLRSGPGRNARKIGTFHLLVTVEESQITRIRVFTERRDAEAAVHAAQVR